MGEIHDLCVLALFLVWFAGATPESQKGQERTKKEGQVQIGKPPRLMNPPRLAALDN